MAIEVVRDGRLLRVTLNRPEKRNALDYATCVELVTAFEDACGDAGVGAVLLSGAGKSFCAGMDLREDADHAALSVVHEKLFSFGQWMTKPVVVAVQGWALAGGTGLVANAHVAIAANDASFGLTEVRIGLWPVMIFPAVVAAVGERKAVELALTTEIFDGAKALAIGLVSEVVEPRNLAKRAGALALTLAGASAAAVQAGLALVRASRGLGDEEQRALARAAREKMMAHPDFAEGVAAFREKRAAVWPSVTES